MRNHLHRIVFIDETATNTKMYKQMGWSRKGERLIDFVPFGHWKTQTFISGLRHNGMTAPWVIDGPMNKATFEVYVETQLAPTLNKGDVVILDNLSSHKSAKAKQILRDIGCWFLFLPPYSPDLNPIEMAFSKLKTLLRKACARSFDEVWKNIGEICDLFSPQECMNYFIAAGYQWSEFI